MSYLKTFISNSLSTVVGQDKVNKIGDFIGTSDFAKDRRIVEQTTGYTIDRNTYEKYNQQFRLSKNFNPQLIDQNYLARVKSDSDYSNALSRLGKDVVRTLEIAGVTEDDLKPMTVDRHHAYQRRFVRSI